MIRVRIKDEVSGKLEYAQRRANPAAEHIARSFAREYVKRLKKNISEQVLSWEALSADWTDRKSREGLDPRTLIATQEYLDSIHYRSLGTSYEIGADARGEMLEFGTIHMPARPHWLPTLDEMDADDRLNKKFEDVIVKILFGRAEL
jgi:hypothetical protein